jgi:hypothetical protein
MMPSRHALFGLVSAFAITLVATSPGAFAFPGPPPDAGRVEFDQGSFHALESSGLAVITVEREHGTLGAVTVDYATSDLSAIAGQDYTAVSGTLSWPDGDGADKTILVPLTIDAVAEGAEFVQLTLSNVTGGAELRPQHATSRLIITEEDDEDDDGDDCDGDDDGDGNSHGSVRFVEESYQVIEGTLNAIITVERRGGLSGNVSVDFAATAGSATAGADFAAVTGTLNWAHADGGLRTFAVPIVDDTEPEDGETVLLSLSNPIGGVAISDGESELEIVDNDAALESCEINDRRLCLLGSRFRAEITYRTATVGSGEGHAVRLSGQSGLFWFFDAENAEMLVKVINGCGVPGLNAYWVFFAATTNVDFTMTVTDTHTGVSRQYRNPYGNAADPIQDVRTFACTD